MSAVKCAASATGLSHTSRYPGTQVVPLTTYNSRIMLILLSVRLKFVPDASMIAYMTTLAREPTGERST